MGIFDKIRNKTTQMSKSKIYETTLMKEDVQELKSAIYDNNLEKFEAVMNKIAIKFYDKIFGELNKEFEVKTLMKYLALAKNMVNYKKFYEEPILISLVSLIKKEELESVQKICKYIPEEASKEALEYVMGNIDVNSKLCLKIHVEVLKEEYYLNVLWDEKSYKTEEELNQKKIELIEKEANEYLEKLKKLKEEKSKLINKKENKVSVDLKKEEEKKPYYKYEENVEEKKEEEDVVLSDEFEQPPFNPNDLF